jgi:hypothetical protein
MFDYVKPVACVEKRRDENLTHPITTPHQNQPNVIQFNKGEVKVKKKMGNYKIFLHFFVSA